MMPKSFSIPLPPLLSILRACSSGVSHDFPTLSYEEKGEVSHVDVEFADAIAVTSTDVPGDMAARRLIKDGWSIEERDIAYVINGDPSLPLYRKSEPD